MFKPEDIIDARTNAGELHLTVAPAALIRTLVLVGQLPRTRTRAEILDAYSGLESVEAPALFMNLTPRGVTAAHPLGPADVIHLPLSERIAFLKGADRLLRPRLGEIEARYCICDMPPGVTLPIAAFASLLREDLTSAHKAWGAFAKIRRWCAERLPCIDGHRGLAGMSFEDFVAGQADCHRLVDGAEPLAFKAEHAAANMLAAYRIAELSNR
jgi:hypothetical protein